VRDTEPAPSPSLSARSRALVAWLLAPATDDVPRHQAVGATFLRVLLGMLWLWNVNWKVPPDFGEEGMRGLYKFTAYAVSDPVFAPYSWVVETVVLPGLPVFGWGVIISETALAVLLLSGAWVRVAALLGIAQSIAITLSVAFAPHEWAWAYLLMTGAHVALLLSSSGRLVAVDAVRAGLDDGRLLARVAGGTALAAGAYGVIGSLGDPLAANGAQIGTSAWEVGLGSFNVAGGVALLVIAVLLLGSERWGPRAATAAAVVALLAAVLMRVQAGFAERLLGGGGTSAALLLTLALVAVVRARAMRPEHSPRRVTEVAR
jgi:hypothetical protein